MGDRVTLSNEGVHPYLWGETAYTGHTDALLISAEGASIKASRIFLAAASPVMKRILQVRTEFKLANSSRSFQNHYM